MKRHGILTLLALSLLFFPGCGGSSTRPEAVWGTHGVNDGELHRPRAIAIDEKDRLYIVDFTARIQVYDRNGKHQGLTWQTPDYRNGRPSGLSIMPDGNLLVSDSHYSCLRIYSPEGQQLKVIGGKFGTAPGEFGYIGDAVQDEDGYFYVAEFGDVERISKLDRNGKFLQCWGEKGNEPGQFAHIRALALGPDGNLYVADACNHRIQIFSRDGKLVSTWGRQGQEEGKLSYPYDLAFSGGAEPSLYIVEFGNNRVQKFTPGGEFLGCFGSPGREPGKFFSPWALAVDSRGRVHVLDTENHRVQRLHF
jgi:DNA-binding beta-propeller fold protein YncE